MKVYTNKSMIEERKWREQADIYKEYLKLHLQRIGNTYYLIYPDDGKLNVVERGKNGDIVATIWLGMYNKNIDHYKKDARLLAILIIFGEHFGFNTLEKHYLD